METHLTLPLLGLLLLATPVTAADMAALKTDLAIRAPGRLLIACAKKYDFVRRKYVDRHEEKAFAIVDSGGALQFCESTDPLYFSTPEARIRPGPYHFRYLRFRPSPPSWLCGQMPVNEVIEPARSAAQVKIQVDPLFTLEVSTREDGQRLAVRTGKGFPKKFLPYYTEKRLNHFGCEF